MTEIKGQCVGYIRVSTIDQNTARQAEQLNEFKLDKLFTDYASGKDTSRPQLQAALNHLRSGDRFIVTSMDRLARNLDDLRKIVKDLTSRGVAVQFIKENITFTCENSPMSTLLLSMMGAFAEFERSLILERQREGIAIAKAKGKYKGRKPKLGGEEIRRLLDKDILNQYKNRTALAKEFNISRQTLYEILQTNRHPRKVPTTTTQ